MAASTVDRPNKIPIQKFSSTDDFNRAKKLHDDMVKIDRKLKTMDYKHVSERDIGSERL